MNIVGVDIGGTFTDLVGYVDGQIVTSKTSTVPADPTRGIATSIELADCKTAVIDEILHGSTIAINTVLERKGARTALLTTEGFRDVYAIGRSNRIEAFNLFFKRPEPLVDRNLTLEIRERVLATGEVLEPLDETSVDEAIAQIDALGCQAVAVCLLHAYVNPDHERRIGAILREKRPDLFVTLSHEILREYREYERTSTTVLNAFVGPRVGGYLQRLDGYLRDASFGGKVHIMRSNGGVMSLRLAQQQPVSMMESGPVAGMIGAGRLAKIMGLERCVGFDMGGTTAKSSLLTNGAPVIETGYVIGEPATGQPMQLPVVDIVEVGAGGGSIAWVDKIGALHVGPQSVGADPGPACYGKGSPDPVVTDADLLLGRINAKRFLNGGMPLDIEASRRVMQDKVAGPLGLGVAEAALGVAKIADAAMSLSVRAVSVNKGVDPRDTAMIAFGGAGPLHAIAIAREIFIPTVVIPKLPGTFSALGMLMASWRQDFVQTLIGRIGALDARAHRAGLRGTGGSRPGPARPRRHRSEERRFPLLRRPALCRPGARDLDSRRKPRPAHRRPPDPARALRPRARQALRPVGAEREHGDRQPAAGRHRRARRYAGRGMAVAALGAGRRRHRRQPRRHLRRSQQAGEDADLLAPGACRGHPHHRPGGDRGAQFDHAHSSG